MSRLKLTKKSEDLLYSQYNATGIIFMKTGEREIASFEFYRGRDNKLYLTEVRKAYPLAALLKEKAELTPEEEE